MFFFQISPLIPLIQPRLEIPPLSEGNVNSPPPFVLQSQQHFVTLKVSLMMETSVFTETLNVCRHIAMLIIANYGKKSCGSDN